MSATRLPRFGPANASHSAAAGKASPTPVIPINADAHARFGHSFGQIAVTSQDTAPIQRQPDEKVDEAPALHLPFGITIPMPTPGAAPPTPAPPAQYSHDQRTERMKQMQDMTNNLATTGQKSAEKNDEYIRE
jgi:hypothetical protein